MAHSSKNQHLTTSRGATLYIGALLGPGLLLLPGLAAAEAGPASILAWLGLLILSGLFAAVFSALGRHNPSAGGVIGYVTAGLGPRAGRATGWMFLAGVVCGAPIVCLIGASYVTDLTGGGQLARAAVALQRRQDGTIYPVWDMFRHEIQLMTLLAQSDCAC